MIFPKRIEWNDTMISYGHSSLLRLGQICYAVIIVHQGYLYTLVMSSMTNAVVWQFMSDGEIIRPGPYEDLLTHCQEFQIVPTLVPTEQRKYQLMRKLKLMEVDLENM
jgi:hypothetical protein